MPKAAPSGSDHVQAHVPGHSKAAAPSLKRYQARPSRSVPDAR